MWAQNSTAMPRAIARLTSDTATATAAEYMFSLHAYTEAVQDVGTELNRNAERHS
jgi:hypothetical protein